MEYIKISNELDCIEADKLFNSLIKYESGFDKIINGNCVVRGFNKEMLGQPNAFAYYVKDNEECVGYIFAYLKTPYNSVMNANIVTVESLFIKEEYRGKGIGKTLIEMLGKWSEAKFKDYVVEITCLSNNKDALKFYDKLGYMEVKTILRKG